METTLIIYSCSIFQLTEKRAFPPPWKTGLNVTNSVNPDLGSVRKTCKWHPENKEKCVDSLRSNTELLNGIVNSRISSQLCINSMIDKFTDKLCEIMTPYCKSSVSHDICTNNNVSFHKPKTTSADYCNFIEDETRYVN